VNHVTDIVAPKGIPAEESEATVARADGEARAGQPAIRRGGDPLARRLRRELRQRSKKREANGKEPDSHTDVTASADEPPPAPQSTADAAGGKVVRAGDELAERARRLKRRRPKRNDGDTPDA